MTQANARISVVIAAFNAQDTLESCVASVLAQTHPHIEVIIADDASTDGTLALAQRLAEADKRIKVASCQINGGPGVARNAGLNAAIGDWIMIVDSDDRILPDRAEKMLDAALSRNADVVFDNLIYVAAGQDGGTPYIRRDIPVFGQLGLDTYIESHRRTSTVPSLGFLKPLIRRSLLESHAIRYRPAVRIGEDTMLILDLYAAGAKVELMQDGYYMYQKRATSISASYKLHHIVALNAELSAYLAAYQQKMSAPEVTRFRDLIEDNQCRINAKTLIAEKKLGKLAGAMLASSRSFRISIQELRSELKRHILKRA